MKKRKQSRKTSRRERIDRWMTRNTYLYKWGKMLLRSRWGRRAFVLLLILLLVFLGARRLERDSVRRFVKHWQDCENRGDFSAFSACLDLSEKNPDRALFPDWKSEFFDTPVQINFRNLAVRRKPNGLFRVEALVVLVNAGTEESSFRGIIHVRRRRGWKIIRVEVE